MGDGHDPYRQKIVLYQHVPERNSGTDHYGNIRPSDGEEFLQVHKSGRHGTRQNDEKDVGQPNT